MNNVDFSTLPVAKVSWAKTTKRPFSKNVPLWDGLFAVDDAAISILKELRNLPADAAKAQKDSLKIKLPVISSNGTCSLGKGKTEANTIPNGYICIDIDGKDNQQYSVKEIYDATCRDPHTMLCTRSCSGYGILAIWRLGYVGSQDDFKCYFDAIKQYFSEELSIDIDPKPSNIVSKRFQTLYEADWLYTNPNADVWIEKAPIQPKKATIKGERRDVVLPLSKDLLSVWDESESIADFLNRSLARCPKLKAEPLYKHIKGQLAEVADDCVKLHRNYHFTHATTSTIVREDGSVDKRRVKGSRDIVKYRNGQKRTKQLFQDGIILKRLNPDVSFDDYFVFLAHELYRYFDLSDGRFTKEHFASNVLNAWNAEDTLKYKNAPKFKVNKTEQIKRGLTVAQARGYAQHEMKLSQYDPLSCLDLTTSVQESADNAGVAYNTMARRMREEGIRTEKQQMRDEMQTWYATGHNANDIAEYCGCTLTQAKDLIRKNKDVIWKEPTTNKATRRSQMLELCRLFSQSSDEQLKNMSLFFECCKTLNNNK